jgi:protein-disulfide isomerase
MKKDMKMILFPVVALLVFAGIFMFFMKKDPAPKMVGDNSTSLMVPSITRDGNYTKGPAGAKVQVVEFFDPECEGCSAFHPIVKRILAEYSNDIEFVARYMLFHGNSVPAAKALEGAGAQGKYWEMYNFLLERQDQWSHRKEPVISIFEAYAKELGLNVEEFSKAFENPLYDQMFAKDMADGQQLGVKGTPTFFINGKPLMSLSYEDFKNAIDNELK